MPKESKKGSADGCADLAHNQADDSNGEPQISAEVDAMLTALASVVVDELIALKDSGMSPGKIEELYVGGADGDETGAGIPHEHMKQKGAA